MRMEGAIGLRGSGVVHRVLDAELAAAHERGRAQLRVVDVGGGSGGWAVPLAVAGCDVTVLEPNPNALATLHMRAEEEQVTGRITVIADDVDALVRVVEPGSADLVLAHGVLEVVDDPQAAMAAIESTVSVAGAVSVLVANRHAAALHRALAGRLEEARQLLDAASGVLADDGEVLLRRYDVDSLTRLIAGAGLQIERLQGDGVVSDSVTGHGDELAAFEQAAAGTPPLRDIATRLHALARRR